MEPVLLPLTPTEELDDHSSASSSGVSGVYPLQSPPDHVDLLAQDPSPDLCLGISAEDDMNRLTQDLVATPESSSSPENVHCSGDCTNIQDGNAATRGLYMSPSGDFLFDEDGIEDDDGLLSPLPDLIGDAAILDEISLLDMALEEGFNPEMTARLDEEGYLLREAAQQETARAHLQSHLGEDQVHPGDYQQGCLITQKIILQCLMFVLARLNFSSSHQTARLRQTRTPGCRWPSASARPLRVLLKPPPIRLHPPLPPLTRQMKVFSQKMRMPWSCVMVHIWRWR